MSLLQDETRREYEAATARRCKIMQLLADAAERAGLLAGYADAARTLSRTCDPRRLPPLRPGEGATWPQVWADAALIAEMAADTERRIAGEQGSDRILGTAAAGDETRAWQELQGETSRYRRSQILARLHAAASQRAGTRAAQLLADLAGTERSIYLNARKEHLP